MSKPQYGREDTWAMHEPHDNGCSEERPKDPPGLELVRKIGSGSYGQVWLGRNSVTGQLICVKMVPLHPLEGAQRAGRELVSLIYYEASGRRQHENLLPIYHVGQTDEVLYYTMQLADDVSGRPASLDPSYCPATLATKLENGLIPLEETCRHAEELLSGLACLHDVGMAHRDVKPANCLIVDGKLRVADFGLLTKTDETISLVGTPRYMPPDGRMDARADVYAAGLVIYEMLTGLPAKEFPRWPASILSEGRKPLLSAVNKVVLKACQREREKRFLNARAMLDALRTAKHKELSAVRRGVRLAVRPVVLLAVAAAIAGWLWTGANNRGTAQVVDVDFVTVPFEAEIVLDGIKAVDSSGMPYRTPCTISTLRVRPYRIVFHRDGLPDLDAGEIDFARQREVVGEWK